MNSRIPAAALATTLLAAQASAVETITIRKDLAPGLPRIEVALKATRPQNAYFGGGGSTQTTEIPSRYADLNKEGKYAYFFPVDDQFDGWRYSLLMGEVKEDYILTSRHSSVNAWALLVAEKGEGERKTFGPKLVIGSNNVAWPLGIERTVQGVTAPVSLYINPNGRSQDGNVTQLSMSASLGMELQVSGTYNTESTTLSIGSQSLMDPVPGPNTGLTMNLARRSGWKSPRSAGAKLSDDFNLGTVTIAVEKIAADYSTMTLVVKDGDLEKLENNALAVGDPLPAFANVDIFQRRMVTRDDLAKAVKSSGWAVLIFGDLPMAQQQGYYGPNQNAIDIPEKTILEQLQLGLSKAPTVAFVVNRIDLNRLYSDYLGKVPDFLVLSNYSNANSLQFIASNPNQPYYGGGWMGGPGQSSFASVLGLGQGETWIVVLDKSLTVKKAIPVQSGELAAKLAEANALMAGR